MDQSIVFAPIADRNFSVASKPTPRAKTHYPAALRGILKERGLKIEELASQAGVSIVAIRQLATQPWRRRAWIVEKVLGVPIWTDAQRFEDLRRSSDFLGLDFVLTKFHPLRSAAVAKGVRGTRTLTNKDALLARVLAHLAETKTHASK